MFFGGMLCSRCVLEAKVCDVCLPMPHSFSYVLYSLYDPISYLLQIKYTL